MKLTNVAGRSDTRETRDGGRERRASNSKPERAGARDHDKPRLPFSYQEETGLLSPLGPRLFHEKWRKGRSGDGIQSSDVGQVRIGLRGVSIGAALQAQQGARSGGGYAPSIDRCARSVLLLTRRSCSRAVQLRGNKNKQKTSEHPFTPTECCRSRACGSPTSRRPRLHR